MPVIRIEVPEGTTTEIKKAIREKTKRAVLTTLAPKETKYDYVAVREVFGEIGDGLPFCFGGFAARQRAKPKKTLVDAISQALNE